MGVVVIDEGPFGLHSLHRNIRIGCSGPSDGLRLQPIIFSSITARVLLLLRFVELTLTLTFLVFGFALALSFTAFPFRIAKIMGYGDYQIGNVTISRVYYVEGLGHNLFSVGQFCDSDLEVKFLRSKDEAPEFIIKFLKMIQVHLNATVRNIHTDNGTEFVNHTLR
ncbi:retrovirus-related pol polyprotein from transposon TNT 1-94 [Tanacetum coccineum]|uniref:Retrovirus-related pol polyprotein from transposon TNT 1-94 n=1 Tax=Tanacetum coccineum TaxID=301880 RepID=A0ABQ5FV20_9ASTR